MPNAAPYTAYKAALDAFTKSLGVELAPSGVRVNCVAIDKTRSHQVNFYDLGEEYDRHIPVWVPAGRYAEGERVSNTIHQSVDHTETYQQTVEIRRHGSKKQSNCRNQAAGNQTPL